MNNNKTKKQAIHMLMLVMAILMPYGGGMGTNAAFQR